MVKKPQTKDMDKGKGTYFETKDISLASYLYASGRVNFVGKKKLSTRDISFLFSPKEVAELLIKQYWNLQAPTIQPKQLFSALRDIKDIIFSS